MSIGHLVVVLSLAVPVGVSYAKGLDGRYTRVASNDLSIVAFGETVYSIHCASCHGANLEGQANWRQRSSDGLLPAPPHDASGHTWHHDDDLLFEIVKYGPGAVIALDDYRSAMPAYSGILSDEDIVAVLAYIKNSWPEEQQGYQQEINEGQQGYENSKRPRTLLDKLFR